MKAGGLCGGSKGLQGEVGGGDSLLLLFGLFHKLSLPSDNKIAVSTLQLALVLGLMVLSIPISRGHVLQITQKRISLLNAVLMSDMRTT